LVGRNIGQGKVEKAKIYAKQCLFLVIVVSMIPGVCFTIFPNQISGIFTSDLNVIAACYYSLVITAIGF
jgi:Na+-driven multidrug efflux pump